MPVWSRRTSSVASCSTHAVNRARDDGPSFRQFRYDSTKMPTTTDAETVPVAMEQTLLADVL